MQRKIFSWSLVFLWMAVIFYFSTLSVIPSPRLDVLNFIIKKTAHIGEFAILYLLLRNALSNKNRNNLAFFLALLYAFSDETHQLFTPGRGAMLRDVFVFDLAGIILAFLFAKRVKSLS